MINYKIIADSIDYYESRKYARIESPWTVTPAVSNITKPPGAKDFALNNGKVLVASAEQSFLYLFLKGFLPPGKYQSVTPCFRDEPFDSLHSKYFIKNELIYTKDVTPENLRKVATDALEFFAKFLPFDELSIIETGKDTFDIFFREIELGSYGIRECDFLRWIYGTGVAEPRLSSVVQKHFKVLPPPPPAKWTLAKPAK